MNTKKFSDKVALVTGGTSGIGKTTATEFARAGAKVVLSGRREKEGASVVAEIQQLGGAAAFIRADVAKDADVKAMVDFTVATYGRLDIAFNNAGVVKSDVEAAISGDGEVDHCFDVGIFCDVRANERGGTAELLDFCDNARAFFFTSAGEDDLGASTGKFGGGRLTDAGGPSGHECDFV